jgi:hypothetical protein
MDISNFGFYPNTEKNADKMGTNSFTPLDRVFAAHILMKIITTY